VGSLHLLTLKLDDSIQQSLIEEVLVLLQKRRELQVLCPKKNAGLSLNCVLKKSMVPSVRGTYQVETSPPVETMETPITAVRSASDGHRKRWEPFAKNRPPGPFPSWQFLKKPPVPLILQAEPPPHAGTPTCRFASRNRRRRSWIPDAAVRRIPAAARSRWCFTQGRPPSARTPCRRDAMTTTSTRSRRWLTQERPPLKTLGRHPTFNPGRP
jgi:hypothetical protein